MREAVIVSAVRSPVARGKKNGALATLHPVDLSAQVMRAAVERVGLDPKELEDVLWGCAMPEAAQGLNIARLALLRAGFPVEVAGATINRFCSSGLQTIAMAAQAVMTGMADAVLAGGVEMMSQVPMSGFHTRLHPDLTPTEWSPRDLLHLHRHGLHRRKGGGALRHKPRGPGQVGLEEPPEGGPGLGRGALP